MYIKRIQLTNIRGFREVDLDLSRPDGSLAGWTVLAGRNGSGKSTLLKAIALAVLGSDAARALQPNFAEWLRSGSSEAEVRLHLEFRSQAEQGEASTQWINVQWIRGSEKGEPLVLGQATSTGKSARQDDKFDVYLAYDPADREEALKIAAQLEERGIRTWIDVWEVRPGLKWNSEINRAQQSASALAVLFGGSLTYPSYSESIRNFLDRKLPVIPVLLRHFKFELSIPLELRNHKRVDLRELTSDWFDDLIWGITGKHPKRNRMERPIQESNLNARQEWFLAAYGPYRRLSGHAVDAQRLMEGPETISRIVSLFREDSSLVESVGWLREIYLQRLESKPGAADLERAVLNLLDDGLLPDGVQVDQVDSEGLWVFQHGIRLPLRELSDGYRTTAALVMDIVRHLHKAYSELRIEETEDAEGSFWRVLHEGVILVDEIDLHLHISWQKRVGFWLKRHFPNIQFIVTTHSPFICQAADPRGLIRLPAPGEDRPVEHVSDDLYNTIVNGSIDDVILTELFGLESPYSEETERLRHAVAELEAKLQTGSATDQDRQELRELRARLPRTMASSVEQALRALTVEE